MTLMDISLEMCQLSIEEESVVCCQECKTYCFTSVTSQWSLSLHRPIRLRNVNSTGNRKSFHVKLKHKKGMLCHYLDLGIVDHDKKSCLTTYCSCCGMPGRQNPNMTIDNPLFYLSFYVFPCLRIRVRVQVLGFIGLGFNQSGPSPSNNIPFYHEPKSAYLNGLIHWNSHI